MMGEILPFMPMFILQVLFTAPVFFIAPKIGQNKVLWVILALIPILGFLVFYAFFFVWMSYMTDTLNTIKDRVKP
jgi:hypothetical protein